MKNNRQKHPIACAISACLLMSATSAFSATDQEMMRRMEMLEQELRTLKAQMASQQDTITTIAVQRTPVDQVVEPLVKVNKGGGLTFGGYLKADFRHVNGDLAYQDYWRGNDPGEVDTEHTGFNVKETRFNMKYTRGDLSGLIEMDFYGGDGNEIATNSTNPRLRHAFIKYKNWMVGQYWSTFTPLAAFPDSLDFAGPMMGEVFVRQPQIRFSAGGFNIALENPETWGNGTIGTNGAGGGSIVDGIDPDEKYPDLVATYRFAGDWGEVQVGALARRLDQGDVDETALAANIGGKFMFGRNDLRFQVNAGESGRYIGGGMIPDLVIDPDTGKVEVEETLAYMMSYRQLWSDTWRSNFFYGASESDVIDIDRSQWGINLIHQLTPDLSVGFEVGNFSVDDSYKSDGVTLGSDADSDYVQMSWKFAL
ncbi:DcaP family trimeric outer membrane transporter [Pseudomaricurvus hydrocarbonicus]|nr:DcaP family trimeric outer membrane transporter [Aestuariicella hydrocarbonica]